MCGSFYKRGKFAWVQDVRANFLCILDGELAATVFSTAWEPWQIIRHHLDGTADICTNERFHDLSEAISRAEQLLDREPDRKPDGAKFHKLDPSATRNNLTT